MRKQCEGGAQWIPACLLQIEPGQVVRTALGSKHTSQMINAALRLPKQNADLITEEGLKTLGIKTTQNPKPLAAQGFQVDDKLITFPAKSLSQPDIFYGPAKQNIQKRRSIAQQLQKVWRKPQDLDAASWNLHNVTFSKPVSIEKMHILAMYGCYGALEEKATEITIKDVVGAMGAALLKHNIGQLATEPGGMRRADNIAFGRALKSWFTDVHNTKDGCSLIVLLFTKPVKWVADKNGSPKTKVKVVDDQHMSNLALKVNLKMGGDNHWLDAAKFNAYLGGRKDETIVLGADVAHPGSGTVEGVPSVACIVGSVDNRFMKYLGSMRLQAGGQEKIKEEHMFSMMKERFQAWKDNNNGRLPKRVLFYRDGVSESQFPQCIDLEIPGIVKAHTELNNKKPDPELKITFVVVTKRHHTRFYAIHKSQSYETVEKRNGVKQPPYVNGNLKPGLLVDDYVTTPTGVNFFLQSHCAIKGTARSAHYHVLKDGIGLGKDSLTEVTMMLCYAFGRATKGVSYVAPAYIADRLCDRGSVWLRDFRLNTPAKYKLPKDLAGDDWPYDWPALDPKTGVAWEFKDRVVYWKHKMAERISQDTSVWGENYSIDPMSERLNPWHPNLDNGMFWM
ncbi:Piwi domain-containing protein [Lophiotrema nucula]|uniref:Piwi domain-containing protein n=1 Tax=Lophiotrema nucula TaxID=690887 RepID=A0A6A5ZT42_9PLEO|nr:Piwi domain-containing protein [Lophiotrema nucula]